MDIKQSKTRKAVKKVIQNLKEVNITPEERLSMIAEAAYYRAEQRGFESPGQEQDWLEAEKEIDTKLFKEAESTLDVA